MKSIKSSDRNDAQWKRKYVEYARFCRKSPWKIDDEHIATFEEFKESELIEERNKNE